MILRHLSLLVAALCAFAAAPLHAQTTSTGNKTALLIGIDSYRHPASEIRPPAGATPTAGRFTPGIIYPDLKGPRNDVQSMRDLLVSAKFGFSNDAIHTLLEKAATRQGILDALELYLVTQPKRGDTVVLYISSHGSMRPYPQGQGDPSGPLFHLSGPGQPPVHVDNTIVPYDWYLGADDIFSRDLRHIFNQAADKGVNLTAIFDSCHSGAIARGAAKPKLVARAFDFDPRPMPPNPYPIGEKPPQSRKDNPVLVLSAALEDQLAIDDQASTPAHGLFTSSLIETLATLPPDRPANDVFHRLQAAMELNPDAINQQPVMDSSAERRGQPLFGGRAGTGPATAAVLSADSNGVLLDIGTAQGIGVNSEFATLTGAHAVLRVTQSVGFTRSLATVLSPANASVQPKDIVALSKLAPPNRVSLLFFAGSANLTGEQIQSALDAACAANLTLVADPTRNPWTHHIAWDGQNWTATEHSKVVNNILRQGEVVRLGTTLTPAALRKVPAGALVWFDAPLPAESLNRLKTTLPADSLTQLTTDRSKAMYAAASAAGPNGIGYAWFKIKDFDAEVQTPSGIGAGCSPGSAYPLRTDYVAEAQPEAHLHASALALAKLFGWYHLQEASSNNPSPFPYQLALRRVPKADNVTDGGATWKGSYALDLVAADASLVSAPPPDFTPRWVYVLAINCQGEGVVLWPFQGAPSAKFPSIPPNPDPMAQPQPLPARIQLPGAPFEITPPYGTDTYLLLTTTTPLTDYTALNFEGVVSRGGGNALDDLLSSTSRGTRGVGTPASTDWSIKVLQTQSIPEPLPTTRVSLKQSPPPE